MMDIGSMDIYSELEVFMKIGVNESGSCALLGTTSRLNPKMISEMRLQYLEFYDKYLTRIL
jgi:hypothetical protein